MPNPAVAECSGTRPTSPCEKELCEWLHFLELIRLKFHYKVRLM